VVIGVPLPRPLIGSVRRLRLIVIPRCNERGSRRTTSFTLKADITGLILKLWEREDEQSMRDRDVEDKFSEMSVKLARHNLEVALKRTKEQCFRAAKEIALESLEGFKKMDAFVRKQYAGEPKKIAEWDKIMWQYEFPDEEDEE
jgi:hypothetical protein